MRTAIIHILVVDDNQEILDILSLMLRRKGFSVTSLIRINDFAVTIKNIRPDIILLDKNLGWTDGCEVCALIKSDEHIRHIRVIMFSAYHKGKADCLSAGADGFLAKPFAMAELLQIIR